MNGDVLEQLVISGELFGGSGDNSPHRHRSPSSSRASSPSLSIDGEDASSYVEESSHRPARETTPPEESIGMGPGRTGVKGVIRDRDEAQDRDREKARLAMQQLALEQKKQDFSGPSYFEELDRDKDAKAAREGDPWGGIEALRLRRLNELKAAASEGKRGTTIYGHLREIGIGGYVDAVEKVPQNVWVVVHIYDSSLGRCDILDSHLSGLARRYPTAKFLRARAGAIGFATSSTAIDMKSHLPSGSRPKRRSDGGRATHRDPDDSDSDSEANFIGAHVEDEDEDEREDEWEPEPDYEVLPTLLVYRAGELAFSWPRVDWEIVSAAGKGGGVGGGVESTTLHDVEALLIKHHIVHPSASGPRGRADTGSDSEEGELELE